MIRGLLGGTMWVQCSVVILAGLAAILPGGAVAQALQNPPAVETSAEAIPGEIIVKYKESAGPERQALVRRQENLQKGDELELIGAEVVEVESGSTESAIRDLNASPDVEYAEPNYKLYSTGFDDEPKFPELWGLHNTGQIIQGSAGTANTDVNGREASARTMGNPSLVVAVIDDGVDFSHPDLAARAWRNPDETPNNRVDDDGNGLVDDVNGWDYFHDDKTVHDPGQDFHGTHVAGTIAASVNNQGVVGVAPNVKIMALKFLSDDDGDGRSTGSASDAILAIQYARKEGVKLSNNSWGGGGFSQALKNAIDASGSLFVTSAGNGGPDGVGDNNDATPSYPASYTSPNILSVAAVNNRGSLGSFSNFGKTSVDISAPGVGILSSLPADPGEPAAVLSSVGTAGKALTSGFGAEEIGTAAGRTSFFTKGFQAVGRGNQQVVLVDDDGSNFQFSFFIDVAPTVASAIQSATGSAPQTIEVAEGRDGPPLSQLSGKTVVWATGEASFSGVNDNFQSIPETITPADQATLTNFLNGGGKLIITGRDALNESEDSAFVKNTLDLNVVPDDFGSTFAGAPGTAFAGESYVFDSQWADQFGGLAHDNVAPANSSAKTQGGYDSSPATWDYLNGTSMAAPHVAGVAALVVSRYPNLLNQSIEIKNIIMNSGRPLTATSGKTVTGDMVDARAALFPRVVATSPVATNPIKTNVARGSNVTATFSDAMNANTVRNATFTLRTGTTSVPATVSYSPATKRATLNPGSTLAPNTVYTVTVRGGPTGVKNTSGDPMLVDKVWRFKTGR